MLRPVSSRIIPRTWIPAQKRCRNDESAWDATLKSHFSLILCKNVLLHFDYAERLKVIRMFHDSLAPGGFFAMEQT